MSFKEVNAERRGHRFLPSKANDWPALYFTEEVPLQEKVIVAHYFGGFADWFVCEFEPDTATAFGWACLTGRLQDGEWGYFSLQEIEQLIIQVPIFIGKPADGRRGAIPLVMERELFWEHKSALDALPEGALG